jgi:hypothetical protein
VGGPRGGRNARQRGRGARAPSSSHPVVIVALIRANLSVHVDFDESRRFPDHVVTSAVETKRCQVPVGRQVASDSGPGMPEIRDRQPAVGSTRRNFEPRLLLVKSSRPPSSSAIFLEIAKPRPVPASLVVKNGSKIFS